MFLLYRYYRSPTHACLQCSTCCPDTIKYDLESQCLQQGLSRNKACRYTGRNCEETEPTLLNVQAVTTIKQSTANKSSVLPFLIVSIISSSLLFLIATFLVYRSYCNNKLRRSTINGSHQGMVYFIFHRSLLIFNIYYFFISIFLIFMKTLRNIHL